MSGLVLSLFPGIGLLDMAFEEQGFCVVRGPDVIWGGDIRKFHPPAGVFDGVIGGPPCQMFSALAPLVRHNGHEPKFGNLIPEYERCVAEAKPRWFVMENVRGAPLPDVEGYDRWAELVTDSDVGGVQPRERRISLGLREPHEWDDLANPFALLEYDSRLATSPIIKCQPDNRMPWQAKSVLGDAGAVPVKIGGSGKRKTSVLGADSGAPKPSDIGAMCEAQGLPRDHLDNAPFTVSGKRKAIGNGVPLPMGRAIARLVLAVTR